MAVQIAASQEWSTGDREVIEYLRHHHFSLPDRLKCVQESIERLGLQLFQTSAVRCSGCGEKLA